ncbi:hypothetical protein BRADI_4g17352v3 [Brachypodium distachyon]|uniref:Uncharacterized protein n=1 Tax=Brachypodium distachyon TaxID=15368 RepID=A0A2K2CNG5_BRADI|nr:hypothetical protein BRADI_4g17352v3 [Brachypodium distachyon]
MSNSQSRRNWQLSIPQNWKLSIHEIGNSQNWNLSPSRCFFPSFKMWRRVVLPACRGRGRGSARRRSRGVRRPRPHRCGGRSRPEEGGTAAASRELVAALPRHLVSFHLLPIGVERGGGRRGKEEDELAACGGGQRWGTRWRLGPPASVKRPAAA